MPEQPDLSTRITAVATELSALVDLVSAESSLAGASHVGDAIAAVEAVGRLMDAARVRALAPLVADPVLAERLGYASPIAAVASIGRISERSARARLKAAAAVCSERSLAGALLPARHPIVREALDAGEIGLDAAELITSELGSVASRTPSDALDAAEAVMVGLARGVSPTGEPMVATVSVDYLAREVRHITAAIDPDGARPREERAVRRRDFRLGSPDEDGLVPATGRLMPEVGVLLAGLLEAHRRSPRFVDPGQLINADDLAAPSDPRTPGQRRHDAFAEILTVAANSDGAPCLDGAPVTVLVTVAASDLASADGQEGLDGDPIATMAGSPFPVSRRTIERFIDAGGYRVVTLDENGAVTGISSPQRCFTPMQRLAIAARDGQRCSTPGCTSPHYMLQAHHVTPDRDNGPTAIDNGILLCYWHHLIVDTGPWEYCMIKGIPYVRGPGIPEWTATRSRASHAA